jgi:hypothetical protein
MVDFLILVVQESNIGDFQGWKDHDAYSKALERLLRDLKVELER